MPNDCAVPGTEFVADRQSSNLCEEFQLLGAGPKMPADAREAARKLFGESDSGLAKEPPKKRFDSLFKDEN